MEKIAYNPGLFRLGGRIGRLDYLFGTVAYVMLLRVTENVINLFGGPLNASELFFTIFRILLLVYVVVAYFFILNSSLKRERDIKERELTRKEKIIFFLLLIFPLTGFFIYLRLIIYSGLSFGETGRYVRVKYSLFIIGAFLLTGALLFVKTPYWGHLQNSNLLKKNDLIIPTFQDKFVGTSITTNRRMYSLKTRENENILLTLSNDLQTTADSIQTFISQSELNLEIIPPKAKFQIIRKIIIKGVAGLLIPGNGDEVYIIKDSNNNQYYIAKDFIQAFLNQKWSDKVNISTSTYSKLLRSAPIEMVLCLNGAPPVKNLLDQAVDNSLYVEIQVTQALKDLRIPPFQFTKIGFINFQEIDKKKTCAIVMAENPDHLKKLIFALDFFGRGITFYNPDELSESDRLTFKSFDYKHFVGLTDVEMLKYSRPVEIPTTLQDIPQQTSPLENTVIPEQEKNDN